MIVQKYGMGLNIINIGQCAKWEKKELENDR